MDRKKIKDVDDNKGLSKFVKKSFEIERVVHQRLKHMKKTRGVTINWFVNDALINELNAVDRYEKMEQAIDRVANMIPDIVSKAVDQSDLRPMLDEIAKDIKPTMDMARVQSNELKMRQAIEFEQIKTNILHRLTIGLSIPDNLIYLKVLESLEADGYIYQTTPGTFQISQRDILRDMDYLI